MTTKNRATLAGLGLAAALVVGGGVAAASAAAGDSAAANPAIPAGSGPYVNVGPAADAPADGDAHSLIDVVDGAPVPSLDDATVFTAPEGGTDGWVELRPDGTSVPIDGLPPIDQAMADHFSGLATALADAGAVPEGTTGEQMAEWVLNGFEGAPFDYADPALADTLAEYGIVIATS